MDRPYETLKRMTACMCCAIIAANTMYTLKAYSTDKSSSASVVSQAGQLDAQWAVIGCGGETTASNGNFTTGYTIGQPAAGLSTGGVFTIADGFWHGGPDFSVPVCATVPGDMNGDGLFRGDDIRGFVPCLLSGPTIGSGCGCADINDDQSIDFLDVPLFVHILIP